MRSKGKMAAKSDKKMAAKSAKKRTQYQITKNKMAANQIKNGRQFR